MLQTETKVLPGAVVKEQTAKRIAQMTKQTGRRPGKKETRDIREDMRTELLTKAFPKKTASLAWIDREARLLVIEAGSQSRADDVVTMLVRDLPGLAVTPVNTKLSRP